MTTTEIEFDQLAINYIVDGSRTGSLGLFELTVQSPDIGAQYFKDVAAVVNTGRPPDKAAFVSVMSSTE